MFVFQSIYDLFLGPSEELHLLPEPLFSLPCEQLVTTALQGTDNGRWRTFSRQTLYMLYPDTKPDPDPDPNFDPDPIY